MRVWLPAIALWLGCWGVSGGGGGAPNGSAERETLDRLQAAGDPRAVVAHVEAVLRAHGDDHAAALARLDAGRPRGDPSSAYHALGVAHYQLGQLRTAAVAFEAIPLSLPLSRFWVRARGPRTAVRRRAHGPSGRVPPGGDSHPRAHDAG